MRRVELGAGEPAVVLEAGPNNGAASWQRVMPLREKMIVLADRRLAGRELERYAEYQLKVLLVRPDRKDERRRFGNLGGMRQWIESVYDTAKGQLDLERHGAHRKAFSPGSPSGCSPWPPPSGITGPSGLPA